MRQMAAFLVVGLSGCLPPPRAWLQMSPEGPPSPGADDSADADQETGLVPEDTGEPPLQCHSLAFGDDGHVEITGATVGLDGLFSADALTIEMWAQLTEETDSGVWLLAGMDGQQAWHLGVEDGELVLQVGGIYTLNRPLPSHGWHHIAGVVDGDDDLISLYVDGQFYGSVEWPTEMISDSENPSVHLGSWDGSGGAWPSLMDEVRLANTAVHSGRSPIEYDDHRSVDDWLAVFRFDDSLENAVSGVSAVGENIRHMDLCH